MLWKMKLSVLWKASRDEESSNLRPKMQVLLAWSELAQCVISGRCSWFKQALNDVWLTICITGTLSTAHQEISLADFYIISRSKYMARKDEIIIIILKMLELWSLWKYMHRSCMIWMSQRQIATESSWNIGLHMQIFQKTNKAVVLDNTLICKNMVLLCAAYTMLVQSSLGMLIRDWILHKFCADVTTALTNC